MLDRGLSFGSFLLVALVLAGCECSSGGGARACATAADCSGGAACIEGECVAPGDGGTNDGHDGAIEADAHTPGGDASGPPCDEGTCAGDARCVDGRCVPFGPGEHDETCTRPESSGPVRPQIQCAFETAPAGDPRPEAIRALGTPLVANLGIGSPSRPSIVYVADYAYTDGTPRGCTSGGVLRVLDGATCVSQAVSTDVVLDSPVTPAIGDLDLDGRPEIVAAAIEGGLAAFRVATDGSLSVAWRTTLESGEPDTWGSTQCQWGAVSLYDLDDDARPEVLYEGAVWDSNGVRVTTLPGWVHIGNGTPVPVGDFDDDGRVEAVAGNATWEFDATTRTFAIESGFSTTVRAGFTAVADLGDFPAVRGDAPGRPEVVTVMYGEVSVRTLAGGLIVEYDRLSEGNGGPPTIADFDGDGVREIGVAFGDSYEVFDLAEDDGRLWSQPSQDSTSQRTGSSVFDFNNDARAEVVYGDECFVRVYDGTTGDVVFSQARFSWTWTENPIVVDSDADGSAEVIMGASASCNPGYCPAVDPLFAGVGCESDADCVSGACDEGLCRCTTDAECGTTYGCVAAIAGTPGDGNVCRAQHRDCVAGIRVYRDGSDRWPSSRTIWNQHGYHVTNVEEDGTIPRTSEMRANWADDELNNFRQNVQGEGARSAGPDLTIQSITALCSVTDGSTDMRATLCNRGPVFLDTGIQVVFDQIGDDGARTRLCDLRTTEPVAPGVCTTVSCTAPVPADGVFEATADDARTIAECREANNSARDVADCLE
ncbi:hypothetical protein [Sandaracinus amylolyticus]|uniref:Rhs-family protein n=1 Tax=Sandaracinus amylolyticus TaxID=927083 RepID=A0A0F6YMP8_9BACT|nr:hypothetical protein [Sandaracinus amylolyticus]AKF10951.1 Rhs-family protein [Sandaracinus amylolyticus]